MEIMSEEAATTLPNGPLDQDEEAAEKQPQSDETKAETNDDRNDEDDASTAMVTKDDDATLSVTKDGEEGDSLLEKIVTEETEDEVIEFKTENVIVDCVDIAEADEFFRQAEDSKVAGETSPEPQVDVNDETNEQANVNDEVNTEDDNTDDLSAMQIVSEAKEACNTQPPSPGHAHSNGLDPITAPSPSPVNGESNQSDEASSKRKSDDQSDCDVPNKRLRAADIHDSFAVRDRILNDFIESSECTTSEHFQTQTEQILAEIRTLNELAKEKEREWNNIIHLKKMKEELLLRMQRKKQVFLMEVGDSDDCRSASNGHSILKSNIAAKQSKIADKKRTLPKVDVNGLDYRQKQRNVLDVQSIIADYRQRHPETVPRRGRRIRNTGGQGDSKVLSFASLALCAGAQVHQSDVNGDLGFLLNAMESNRATDSSSRPSSAESGGQQEPSFKDMLVQFAKLSQSERQELIQNAIKPPPPPYPEVTVHPVTTTATTTPTNSLLHGILTKSPPKNAKSNFSPTLARLLTAPERATCQNINNASPNNMSISEILSTSKARNEITITPVNQYEAAGQTTKEEEEAEDNSADRLVIDETNEDRSNRNGDGNSSDGGEEVPQCQGCNQKSALFVCAGCGNQWYCSRDCQVAAWDEHSEVCSG